MAIYSRKTIFMTKNRLISFKVKVKFILMQLSYKHIFRFSFKKHKYVKLQLLSTFSIWDRFKIANFLDNDFIQVTVSAIFEVERELNDV